MKLTEMIGPQSICLSHPLSLLLLATKKNKVFITIKDGWKKKDNKVDKQ
jgi:hypothetical protein